MNALVAHAVSSFFSKWIKQNPVPVGDHFVDEVITLHVTGVVKKLEDEEFPPTIKIAQKAVLAFLLPSLGATREIQIEKLREACKKAILCNGMVEDELKKLMKDVESAFALVESEVISHLPLETRAGKTIVKCNVDEVVAKEVEVVDLTVREISEAFSIDEKTIA